LDKVARVLEFYGGYLVDIQRYVAMLVGDSKKRRKLKKRTAVDPTFKPSSAGAGSDDDSGGSDYNSPGTKKKRSRKRTAPLTSNPFTKRRKPDAAADKEKKDDEAVLRKKSFSQEEFKPPSFKEGPALQNNKQEYILQNGKQEITAQNSTHQFTVQNNNTHDDVMSDVESPININHQAPQMMPDVKGKSPIIIANYRPRAFSNPEPQRPHANLPQSHTTNNNQEHNIANNHLEHNPENIRSEPNISNNKLEPEMGQMKGNSFFHRVLQGVKSLWNKNDNNNNAQLGLKNSDLEMLDNSNSDANSDVNSTHTETVAYNMTLDAKPKRKHYYYDEAWHIPSEEVEILGNISSGTFGEVARARWRGSDVAVKTLKTAGSHRVGDKVLELFLKEVSILSKLRHPSIVLFMGASVTPRLSIIMEYLPKGSLHDLLHVQKEKIVYHQMIRMAKEIAEGLNYLHLCSPKIIHRDIKSSNILVTESRSVKIADFGISRETTLSTDSHMTGFMGTSSYMSPEMIQGVRYTEKVDVYSFGILLWELHTHKTPFKSMHALQVAQKVLQGMRPVIPEKCPPELSKLLEICWHAEPSVRPSFMEIIQILNEFHL